MPDRSTSCTLASASAAARRWASRLASPNCGSMTSGGDSSSAFVPRRASAAAIATTGRPPPAATAASAESSIASSAAAVISGRSAGRIRIAVAPRATAASRAARRAVFSPPSGGSATRLTPGRARRTSVHRLPLVGDQVHGGCGWPRSERIKSRREHAQDQHLALLGVEREPQAALARCRPAERHDHVQDGQVGVV